jgi:hypothetical protein
MAGYIKKMIMVITICIVILIGILSWFGIIGGRIDSVEDKKGIDFVNIISNVYRNVGYDSTINGDFNIIVSDRLGNPANTIKGKNSITVTFDTTYFYLNANDRTSYDKEFLKKVITHELGHVISLQPDQIKSPGVFDEYNVKKDQFLTEELLCVPGYYSIDGCYHEKAYLSKFYNIFWTGDLRKDYNEIQNLDQPSQQFQRKNQWDELYRNQFISDNALVSPEEDFAESFAYFVLGKNGIDMTEKQKQKADFFLQYPQLVQKRLDLLKALETFIK